MDLTSPTVIKHILREYQITPKKHWGQNFLVNRSVVEKLMRAISISSRDTVLEVGPGLGVITNELAKRAEKVIAVEKDSRIIPFLKKTLGSFPHVEIIEGDVRNIDTTDYGVRSTHYKLVGNLPFYLTNYLIRTFLEAEHSPTEIAFIVQKEVGERICAKPPHMNILAVAVQFYGEPHIVAPVPRSSFWPQPDVDAVIITITRTDINMDIPPREFFTVARAGFSHPRKYLTSNLEKKLGIKKEILENIFRELGIGGKARAEELSIETWRKIVLPLSKYL